MKAVDLLCLLLVVLVLLAAGFGIVYTTGGSSYLVENIYGESVELYGDGIYRHDSTFKAGINKGTDAVMAAVALALAVITVIAARTDRVAVHSENTGEQQAKTDSQTRLKSMAPTRLRLIQCGLLVGILYYAACLVFGVTFNQLFPIYVLLFSSALFALIFKLGYLIRTAWAGTMAEMIPNMNKGRRMTGTAVFLIISGSSVLMWLSFIVPAIVKGVPLADIQTYTTEPTYVLDLAIVLPVYVGCAVALLRKRRIAFVLTPVLLTFIIIIGAVVIGQTVFQQSIGIAIPLPQFIGLVLSFVILGIFALILNIRFLRKMRSATHPAG